MTYVHEIKFLRDTILLQNRNTIRYIPDGYPVQLRLIISGAMAGGDNVTPSPPQKKKKINK